MDEWETPKYIASLIAAVNDGAKTAQTGALALATVGIYLLAVTVSTTDEDLLMGHTTNLAQFGVQVSPAISFAIAPIIFVSLHFFTLIRYDMLGKNLMFLKAELDSHVEPEQNRERCRQLLANIEFIVAVAVPSRSPLHSQFFAWIVRATIILFPVLVLISVQLTALRYQNETINWSQRILIVSDLALLMWYFSRSDNAHNLKGENSNKRITGRASAIAASAAIIVADLAWTRIPGSDENRASKTDQSEFLKAAEQPLDELLCPIAKWGCRSLAVDHRVLVEKVWKPDGIVNLIASGGHDSEDLAGVQGAFLSGRILRRVDLEYSSLFGSNMLGADLSGAILGHTHLNGSELGSVDLSYALLAYADMEGVDASYGTFVGVNLRGANLSDADLSYSNMNGADCAGATMIGVNLEEAKLIGAYLNGADLSEAINISDADLTGATYDAQTKFPKDFDPKLNKMKFIANK